MFLDASIIVAILAQEPDWDVQSARIEPFHGRLFHSPIVRFEAVIALARIGRSRTDAQPATTIFAGVEKLFDDFILEIGSQEVDIAADISRQAIVAARIYGKAVGHKAGLNFGDCFSYAAAKTLKVGLLYKGNDFAQTDLA